MTLTEIITDATRLGFCLSFSHEPFNLVVTVSKWGKDDKVNNYGQREDLLRKRSTWLPYSDHAYEQKIMDCIRWMIDEINNESPH